MLLRRNPFFFLLGGLLVALLITPTTGEYFPGTSGIMLTLTLLISVLSLSASRQIYIAVWSLIAAKLILGIAAYFNPAPWIFVSESALMLMFFILAALFSFRRVFEDDQVDMNRIAGAISIYMLIGLIWSSLYFFLFLLDPQAFKGLPDFSYYDVRTLDTAYTDLGYFSYVTLSTLGYGDITPASRVAQSLALLEAISGVMYVAVLIAAMVGTYRTQHSTPP